MLFEGDFLCLRSGKVNFSGKKKIADGRELERLGEYREDPAKRQRLRSENHEVVSTLANIVER